MFSGGCFHATRPRLVLQDDVESMDDTRDVSKTSEGDVDEEVASTALLKHHSQRGEDDGKDELKDIGAGKSHVCCSFG